MSKQFQIPQNKHAYRDAEIGPRILGRVEVISNGGVEDPQRLRGHAVDIAAKDVEASRVNWNVTTTGHAERDVQLLRVRRRIKRASQSCKRTDQVLALSE